MYDINANCSYDDEQVELYLYDEAWRLSAIFRQDPGTGGGSGGGGRPPPKLYQRYTYHAQGMGGFGNALGNDQVLQREMDGDGDGVIEDIQVYAQNPRGDVVGLPGQIKGSLEHAFKNLIEGTIGESEWGEPLTGSERRRRFSHGATTLLTFLLPSARGSRAGAVGGVAAEAPARAHLIAQGVPEAPYQATLGTSTSTNYRRTFFEAHPELEGEVVVHHAVGQQAANLYPTEIAQSELHSLENLRGIPKELNADVHLSRIRRDWNKFYRETVTPSRSQLLQMTTEIDKKYGSQFNLRSTLVTNEFFYR